MATTATGVINDILKLSQAERVKLSLLVRNNFQANSILTQGRVPAHLSKSEVQAVAPEMLEQVQNICKLRDDLEYGEGNTWVKDAPEGE